MTMTQPNLDSRLKRSAAETRADRRAQERAITENRELSDSERREAYRKALYQTHLPDLPPIKGYHVCWLTTTNPKDSIPGRLRLGYELIKASEIPGFEYANVKTGEYAGYIGVNEMLAAKIPLHLYEDFMTISHHEQPLEEEGAIIAEVMKQQEETRGLVGSVQLFGGTAQLGKGPAPPRFADEFNES
jgi:hypothetical protein